MALGGRDAPGVVEALVGRLADPDEAVRWAAVRVLADRESPQSLLILARKVRTLGCSSLTAVTRAAEQLMIRSYRRIDPADQPGVLAAMGWLTTAVLTDSSA